MGPHNGTTQTNISLLDCTWGVVTVWVNACTDPQRVTITALLMQQ